MINLVFGLPGTGKTTVVNEKGGIHLDLGNIPPEVKDLVNPRLQKYNSSILSLIPTDIDVGIDGYPEYFDKNTLPASKLGKIYFFIPKIEHFDLILERVGKRDGFKSVFYKLYSKKIADGTVSGLSIAIEGRLRFGNKVIVYDYYDGKQDI